MFAQARLYLCAKLEDAKRNGRRAALRKLQEGSQRVIAFCALAQVAFLVFVLPALPIAAAGSAAGDERVLTFTRADGALAASAEDGSQTARLALPRGGFVASHAWSHDGRRIAFSRCRGRNCRLDSVHAIRADGSGQRLVIANAGGAVWMPDDKHLLVSRLDRPAHWIVSVGDRSRRRYAPRGLACRAV
jgi:hypothetical protein